MTDVFNTDDMLDTYLYENRQLLEKLQQMVLAKKDAERFDQMTIHKIFRTMHTIKGSSGVMMFDTITKVAHKLEDVFAVIRESQPEHVPHVELVEFVLEVADFISEELAKVEMGKPVDADPTELIARLDVFLELVKSKAEGTQRENYVTDVSTKQFYIAPAEKTDSFDIVIDLESSVEEIEARVERTQRQIMEEAKTKNLVPGDFVIQTKETESRVRADKSRFISVDIAKLDHLSAMVDALEDSSLKTEIKQIIVEIRRVPLTNLFQKMNRIVFDMSRKLGKEAELVMEGEDTEVDKSIAEKISDPLMHLVRNAIDHGIEMPEERIQAGKSARGQIVISAYLDTEYLWITVSDNGAGLDREKIIKKAHNMGILDVDKSGAEYTDKRYSDKEVYQWITLPGFSTRDEVSEFSGRGVGMDAVATNIKAIGGRLEIESEKGKGSRMILCIPLA